MPTEQQCSNCVHYKSGAYGKKCSYYGRVPAFDGSVCEGFEGIYSSNNSAESQRTGGTGIVNDNKWPEQCHSCKKLTICKKYNTPPSSQTCPNYLSAVSDAHKSDNFDNQQPIETEKHEDNGVRMDHYYPGMIDMEHYSKLKWLSGLCLFAGIWTVFITTIGIIFNPGDALSKVLNAISAIYFCILCTYTYYSIRKRKPAAIYYARFIMIVCILSWLVSIAFGNFTITPINIVFGLGTLIYGSAGLYLTFSNDEVKEVFPKEYRKTKWKDYLFSLGYILIPFVIAGSILLTSWGIGKVENARNARSELMKAVKSINDQCPVDVGYWKTTSVKYENNTITYNYLVNESSLSMDKIEKNKEKIATLTLKRIDYEGGKGSFIEYLINEKAALKFEYVGNQTGKVASVKYDHNKIKDLVKNNHLSDREFVQLTIDIQKLLTPMYVDEITLLSDVYLRDGTIHYVYNLKNIKESELGSLDFEYLKTSSLLDLRYSLTNTPLSSSTYSKMATLGYGAQYEYSLDNKQIGSYRISPSDISHALQHPLYETEYKQELLQALIEKSNRSELPIKIDRGLILESVGIENNNFTFYYSVDDYLYNLSAFESKETIEKLFIPSDLQTDVVIMATACDKGLSYHFKGKRSGKTVPVVFSASEIESLLNN